MARHAAVTWLPIPEDHDYPAARSYLRLIYPDAAVTKIVARLRNARATTFKAKDIFRAARLPLLPLSNSHVKRDEKKILAGESLSPLLLVRDRATSTVVVADGYHRLCAVYAFDEDAVIPCKIV